MSKTSNFKVIPLLMFLTTLSCSDDFVIPTADSYTLPVILNPVTKTDGAITTKIFDMKLQAGRTAFKPGSKTDTLGINGDLLGPIVFVSRGDKVKMNVTNEIGETTTLHWHGLHIPAKMDGGPHQMISDGETWSPEFTIDNRAGFYWYHPHLEGVTGPQVYKGLAGLMIIQDPEETALSLPRTYGVDDFPIVIQDRRFDDKGQLSYMTDIVDHTGMRGPNVLVNGGKTPPLDVPAQHVRFRILNGSNARIYHIGLSNNAKFNVIASDGGLLSAPVSVTRQTIAPGERYEIVVDFSGNLDEDIQLKSFSSELDLNYDGTDDLDTSDFKIMNFHVVVSTSDGAITSLPTSLSTIASLSEADQSRTFVLQMKTGGVMTINDNTMKLDRIDEVVYLDDTEVWTIRNMSPAPHPFHIHDIQFQIISKGGSSPAASESGWKDTVLINSHSSVKLITKFEDFADPDIPYMYHCHILEHEDRGMMGQFLVKER